MEVGLFHNLEPSGKACLAIRMFVPELNQCFAGNDVHTDSLSHFEIFDKVPVWCGPGLVTALSELSYQSTPKSTSLAFLYFNPITPYTQSAGFCL